MATFYFPYFPLPPPHNAPSPPKVAPPHNIPSPPQVAPPHHPITPPPPPFPVPATPPNHPFHPPPPTAKPPSHSISPPPPHRFPPPSPPHIVPPPHPINPPQSPPHIVPPPPPINPPPLPPNIVPPPPPTPGHHSTVIVVVFVSLGGLFFLAFLSIALCCFIKKNKKKMDQKTEILDFDEHMKVQEAIMPGPHGEKIKVLTIEEDVHFLEEIKKNEKLGEGSHIKSSQDHPQGSDMSASSSQSHQHHIEHKV